MTSVDLLALSPFVALGISIVAALLAATLVRHHATVAGIAVIGLVAAIAALPSAASRGPTEVTPLLVVDGHSLFFIGLLLVASLAVVLLTYGYAPRRTERPEEIYVLLLLGTFGAAVLAASRHFATLFLGLETLSVALYGLIGYFRQQAGGIEAALKYLVLAGASSALLVFGMALMYADLGTLEIPSAAEQLVTRSPATSVSLVAGFSLLIAGLAFKLALVPFHRWAPEIYAAAPTPVAAFIATVSKGAVLGVLLSGFSPPPAGRHLAVLVIVGTLAAASMIIGNLLALLENDLKRILAYSSIAHMGYALVAFLTAGPFGATALAFYVAAYFVTALVAFGVIAALESQGTDLGSIDDYRGLAWRHPYLAGALGLSLLSLAGIPLTAGFFGKLYVALAGVSGALWLLVAMLVAGSALGLFYYLRVVARLVAPAPEGPPATSPRLPALSIATVGVLAAALIVLGVYPVPIQQAIRLAFDGLP